MENKTLNPSVVGLTPIQYFHWTYVDDLVHVILGFVSVLIGDYGILNFKKSRTRGHISADQG
jgi:aminopeptidase-like protein